MKLWVPRVRVTFERVELRLPLGKHSPKSRAIPVKEAGDVSELPTTKRRLPKKVILALIILLVVGSIVFIIRTLNAPAEGSISQTPPSQSESIDPYAQGGSYNGKYVSFKYPPYYKIAPSKVSGSYLEVVALTSTDITGTEINVGVMRESISDDSGVNYRRLHSDQFKETSNRYGTVFKSTDGLQEAYYMPHGDLLASVAVTKQNPQDVDSDTQFIATSLIWK